MPPKIQGSAGGGLPWYIPPQMPTHPPKNTTVPKVPISSFMLVPLTASLVSPGTEELSEEVYDSP